MLNKLNLCSLKERRFRGKSISYDVQNIKQPYYKVV